MKYTNKEILEAVAMIKDICTYNENGCEAGRCPFCNEEGSCLFTVSEPHEWALRESAEEKAWTVFRR